MRTRIVWLCCLVAVLVVTLVPRNAWILRTQMDSLSGLKHSLYAPPETPIRPDAPGHKVLELRLLMARDPDYKAILKLAKEGPEEDPTIWLMSGRIAAGALGRSTYNGDALTLAKEAAGHLSSEEHQLFKALLEILIAHREGRDKDAWAQVRGLSQQLPLDKPNLALAYQNGYQEESRQVADYEEAVHGYRGEYGRFMSDASVTFNEMGALRQLFVDLCKSASDERRIEVALIGAHLTKTADTWISIIVGRTIVESALKPDDEVRPSEFEARRKKEVEWASQMSKRTGSDLPKRLEAQTRFAKQPLPEEFLGDMEDLETPFKVGAGVLAGMAGLLWSLAWAVFWAKYSDRLGYRAATPHLAAAAGWIIAAIFMAAPLGWLLGLVSLSHLSFAAAMASDRFAKIATAILAIGVSALFAVSPTGWLAGLPGLAFFLGAAILPWISKQEARLRWGMLAGWAISAGCLALAWIAPEGLLPVVAWVVGLLVVRQGAKARPTLSVAGVLLSLILFGLCASLIAVHYSRPQESWFGAVLFALVLCPLALLPARAGRAVVLKGGSIAAVLATLVYVGVAGWTLRSDRRIGEMRKDFATLGEKMRERGQESVKSGEREIVRS